MVTFPNRLGVSGFVLVGFVAALSLSSAAQAQGSLENRPAITGLADRITASGKGEQDRLKLEPDSQGLSEPMYVEQALPPRRPSPGGMAVSRPRTRTETSPEVWVARPVEAARPAPRRNSLCQTDRCPNANMVGIQY